MKFKIKLSKPLAGMLLLEEVEEAAGRRQMVMPLALKALRTHLLGGVDGKPVNIPTQLNLVAESRDNDSVTLVVGFGYLAFLAIKQASLRAADLIMDKGLNLSPTVVISNAMLESTITGQPTLVSFSGVQMLETERLQD